MDFKLFSKLSALPGPCGREGAFRAEIIKIIKPLADQIKTDAVGNIIALKKGSAKGKKLMLAAHMDEVSLRIKYIDDNGFLRFLKLGNIDPRTLLSQRVLIHTEKGPVRGVIGAKPAHYSTGDHGKAITEESLYIDIGLVKEEAAKIVSLGDAATLEREPAELKGGFFTAKAIDDRAGVYILIEVMKQLKNKKPAGDIYFVFTVQEEFGAVGLLGAYAASAAIRPDVALAVDTTGALDVPDIPKQDFVVKSGGGIAITLVDSMTIAHDGVNKHLKEICQKHNIPWQYRISSRGGNEANAMQRSGAGIPVSALSVPVRYIHSNVEVANKRDIDAAIELVKHFAMEAAKRQY